MNFHLAQVNIAIAKYSYDDLRFAGFVDNLDRIYELAESTPGFVWRHITVNDDAEVKAAFAEGNLIFNMSVWESKEALRDFIYLSEHVDILRQRGEWFVPQNRPIMALWWQAAGTIPTIAEAKHRLERLAQAGATDDAFTFRHFFDAPGLEEASNGR